MVRKLIAGLALGIGSAVIVLLLALTGWLDLAELKSYDRRMLWAAKPDSVSKEIVLVEINDTSIRDMQPTFGRYPWPRIAMAFLINYLNRGPAKVVAVDISYPERDSVDQYDIVGNKVKGADSDAEFAASVKEAGNVIMLADSVSEGLVNGEKDRNAARWPDPGYRPGRLVERRPVVLPPYQQLTDASAGLGHNFVILDDDGPLRRMAPFVENEGKYLPALGLAAAMKARNIQPQDVSSDGVFIKVGDRRLPVVAVNKADSYSNS